MGLLDILATEGKKFIKDALPGGRLNPEVTPQGLLDTAALATMPVPVLGDAVGLGADAYRLAKNPQERTPLNYGLAALGALPLVPAGMFIGKGAKTWDALAADKAAQMEKAGTDPRAIWKETGTFRSPDGHLRQEIDDSAASYRPGAVAAALKARDEIHAPMRDVLDHRPLYDAYDKLGLHGWKVSSSQVGSADGHYNHMAGNVVLNPDIAYGLSSGKSTTLHELQHAIQAREGLARGGSPFTAPMFATEARRDELSPYYRDKINFDELSQKVGELGEAKYLRSLKELSVKPSLKPSAITNLSPWYEHSDDIRAIYGPMPKRAGPERDAWLNNAAGRMYFLESQRANMPEYKLMDYMKRDLKDIKSEYAKIDRQRSKFAAGSRAYRDVERKFDDISKMSDFEQYRRLAGEAEARATQARMNLNSQQRREIFPLDSYDVPIDQLIIRK
jgi:hypothetical protein